MATIQKFQTQCEECGNEVYASHLNLDGGTTIIVDFIEHTPFECEACGKTTYFELDKYTG